MGGRDYCCVVGCVNRRSKSKLPFHGIPKKPEHRRKAWIKASGRQCHGKHKFIVTEYTRICGAHFVNGVKSNNPLDVDYVPTVNLPRPISLTPVVERATTTSKMAKSYSDAVQNAINRKKASNKYCARKKLILCEPDIDDVHMEVEVGLPATQSQSDYEFVVRGLETNDASVPKYEDHVYAKAECPRQPRLASTSTSVQTEDQSYCHDEHIFKARPITETYVQTDLNAKCDKTVQIDSFDGDMCKNLTEIKQKNQMKIIKTLKEKVTDLSKECTELKRRVFSSSNMLHSNDQVQFYTGLPNLETYNALFNYLQPKALNLTYWRGKSMTKTRSRLGGTKLSLEEQFFMTLVRLRLNLSVEDLSDRFGVSVGTISSVFNTWCRFLRLELEDLFPYPTAEQVQRNVPSSFSKYPNTRLIIDCTEIFVQKPSALKAQRQTWSNYKHRNTHKILVGITPDGTVVFISSLFGGSASDKFIVKHSGLLKLIEVGDNIMADRGFDIQAQLSKLGAHLNMPPFRSGSYQLTPEQVEETRRIAEVRIHVERAIQRIKTFSILCGTMPITLHMVAEDIFKTCAYLTNFQTPILKSE